MDDEEGCRKDVGRGSVNEVVGWPIKVGCSGGSKVVRWWLVGWLVGVAVAWDEEAECQSAGGSLRLSGRGNSTRHTEAGE